MLRLSEWEPPALGFSGHRQDLRQRAESPGEVEADTRCPSIFLWVRSGPLRWVHAGHGGHSRPALPWRPWVLPLWTLLLLGTLFGAALTESPHSAGSAGGMGAARDKDGVYPQQTSCCSSWWVFREDLMLNLLIRTNYAKITLKPCLIDDIQQWEFREVPVNRP